MTEPAGAFPGLDELPFARALSPHDSGLAADTLYDTVHFDGVSFDDADLSGCRFLECALTRVSVTGGQLRRASFTDVYLRDVRLVSAGLTETTWIDVQAGRSLIAGAEAFGSRLRRVVFSGCKLDSVNFRETKFEEVRFEQCVLTDVDFSGATLKKVSFPGSRLTGVKFVRMNLDRADLRGAELGITVDPLSLRGAIVTSTQLAMMAPLLAESMGIVVSDD
jgi:uncharacterized protein YjbI with pentapeptide repeats